MILTAPGTFKDRVSNIVHFISMVNQIVLYNIHIIVRSILQVC